MKRGIVVERTGKYAIVLTLEGEFRRVRCQGAVGEEVYFAETVRRRRFAPISFVSMAASILLALALLPSGFPLGTDEVYAYVSVDINPSVEVSINRMERVLGVTPLNEDAELLLASLPNLRGEPLARSLALLVDAAERQGYVQAYGQILVTTTPVKEIDTEKIKNNALKGIHRALSEKRTTEEPASPEVTVATIEAPPEVREEAQANNLSPGRYVLYLALHQKEEVLDLEELRRSSIDELSKSRGGLDDVLLEFDGEVLKQWLAWEKEKSRKTAVARKAETPAGTPESGRTEAVQTGTQDKEALRLWLQQSLESLEKASRQETEPAKKEDLLYWISVLEQEARKLEEAYGEGGGKGAEEVPQGKGSASVPKGEPAPAVSLPSGTEAAVTGDSSTLEPVAPNIKTRDKAGVTEGSSQLIQTYEKMRESLRQTGIEVPPPEWTPEAGRDTGSPSEKTPK